MNAFTVAEELLGAELCRRLMSDQLAQLRALDYKYLQEASPPRGAPAPGTGAAEGTGEASGGETPERRRRLETDILQMLTPAQRRIVGGRGRA